MSTVNYSSKFKDVLQLAKKRDLFIGSGNPNARILILGKEAAIDEKLYPEQHHRELTNNICDWTNNFIGKIQLSEIDNWFITPKYNPLYPYKGQINIINRKKNIDNKIIYNGGTSKTWYNYQKIIDYLIYDNIKSPNINFHEHAFISELNQVTGPYSKTIPKKIRKESIKERKVLFEAPFFKEFPITIVAVGHYVKEFDIDLQDTFKMTYIEEYSKEHSKGLDKEYINVHYDNLENPTKLLIHTNQLSMVSNELINRLGNICNDFLNKKTL